MKSFVLPLSALLFGALASPSLAQTLAPTKTSADLQKTRQLVARILRETSVLRGLPIKKPVQSGVKTRAQVEAMVVGRVQTELTARQLEAGGLFLRQLGLAPAGFDLKKTYVAMLGEQIAGYYDSKTKVFVTTDRVDAGQLEIVMAHELTHALQDQHFDLSRLEKWPEHDSDARLAMAALVEGDATLVMSRYMTANPLRVLGALASSLKAQSASPTFNQAPLVLRESLTFPYLEGLKFAQNLLKTGGNAAISAAFTDLPQSSEQILHFEKYLAREAPTPVKARDLSAVIGPKWTLLDHDVSGEIGLFLNLSTNLKNDEAAKSAAAGWAGDRYYVYRGPQKAALVVQDCRFDTDLDARQWQQAYARATSNRFGLPSQKRGALEVWSVATKGAAANGVWMERRGKRVIVFEGTSGAFSSPPLFARLWR